MRAVLFGRTALFFGPLHRLSSTKNEDSPKEGAEKFISAVKALNASMGIPERLSGIRKEDIPIMAKHAEREANPLYPVPILMTENELAVFYEQIADWSNEL